MSADVSTNLMTISSRFPQCPPVPSCSDLTESTLHGILQLAVSPRWHRPFLALKFRITWTASSIVLQTHEYLLSQPNDLCASPDYESELQYGPSLIPLPRAVFSTATIWTDGLVPGSSAGCALCSGPFTASYKSEGRNGLSSTTAELTGIFSIVYHHDHLVPFQQISTDSQAAIICGMRLPPKTRSRLEDPNADITEAIQELV